MFATKHALGDGACEVAVRDAAGKLVAVITHPMAGADWFIHYPEWKPRGRTKTLKAALAEFGIEELFDPLKLRVGRVVPRDERVMPDHPGAWMLRTPTGWVVCNSKSALEEEAAPHRHGFRIEYRNGAVRLIDTDEFNGWGELSDGFATEKQAVEYAWRAWEFKTGHRTQLESAIKEGLGR